MLAALVVLGCNERQVPDQLAGMIEEVCARAGTAVECVAVEPWGEPGAYRAPDGEFTSVAAEDWYACALDAAGELTCWGSAARVYTTPPAGPFASVWLNYNTACALRADGSAECWVIPQDLPDGTVLAPSSHVGPFSRVTAAGINTCGLRLDGSMECWYEVETYFRKLPTERSGMKEIDGDGAVICVINDDDSLECFGRSGGGLWRGPKVNQPHGVEVGSGGACVLDASGEPHCWGDNPAWIAQVPEGPFTQLAGGVRYMCGLRPTGVISCWGCAAASACPADFEWVGGELRRVE